MNNQNYGVIGNFRNSHGRKQIYKIKRRIKNEEILKAKKGIPKRLYERLNHKIRDNPNS